MRQLTRFGTAGQVYRAGEPIFPRRAKYPAVVEDEEPNPEPGVTHWDQPYPWVKFGTHAAIDAWVEARDLEVGPGWFDLTLPFKKVRLRERFG